MCPFQSAGVVRLTQLRCRRLNKDCQPLQTVRKRKTLSRPSVAKTERLEEKLDGLYKLLQSSASSTSAASVGQTVPVSTAPTSNQPSPESLQSAVTSPQNGGNFDPCSTQQKDWCPATNGLRPHAPTNPPDAAYVASGTRSTVYHCPNNSLVREFEPSSDEAEECLKIFRQQMITYFPFIMVPEAITANELRRDRPFLWLCMMSVTSKSSESQKALGREVRITMGREILIEGRNNIDLLLGILVFVAWYASLGL